MPEDFDDDTPVSESPDVELLRRTRRQDRKLEALHTTLTDFCERDEREHREMRADSKATSTEIGGLKVQTAEMKGTLGQVLEEVRSQRRISEGLQKIVIETNAERATLALEDKIDAKKTKRGLLAKLIGLLIGGISALIATGIGIQSC